ncbi:MAG TPA: HAMP domain-containing sensor histidine kinase [Ktedonobacteraceae bacterium]
MLVISRVYKALSLVIIIVGMIALIMQKNDVRSYSAGATIIIVDLVLLCIITLVGHVRQGGVRSILHLVRSMRFRLTFWYAALLALILFILSSIVLTTERQNLSTALNDDLRTRLAQVASTYDAQKGLPSSLLLPFVDVSQEKSPTNGVVVQKVLQDNGVVLQKKLASNEAVLLVTPQGRPLQKSESVSGDDGSQIAAIMKEDYTNWQDKQRSYPDLVPKSQPLGPAGNGMQVFDLENTFSYSLPDGNYEFMQGVIVNQQGQAVALLAVGIASVGPFLLNDLSSILALAAPLCLLLSVVGGYWLAGRTLRPVQTITRTAQEISETDLHRRLNLKQRDELGELGGTFDGMLARLEAAFERQRQFTADASHELRTPLTIVDLEAGRALSHELTPQENRQIMTVIQQENRHMARLVNDLLMLARADGGQSKLRHETVDLSEVVVDTVERLAPQAQQSGMSIKMAPLPELTMRGDRIYLMQLLTNIVENALKYSAGVGTRVEIDLVQQYKVGEGWARLRVRDDGPGIDQEHLPHLFERFYRVDQSRTRSQGLTHEVGDRDAGCANGCPAGSGLGLAIAQWIAQEHGGEIRVQSQPGRGSIFEIWLPLETAEAMQKEGKSMSQQRMGAGEYSQDGPPSYSVEYDEIPRYNDHTRYNDQSSYARGGYGQKLSLQDAGKAPSAGQRLVLAIVSMVLWVVVLIVVIAVGFSAHGNMVAAFFLFFGLLMFTVLVGVINVGFNARG